MNAPTYMPPIDTYIALANAIHDEDDTCLEGGAPAESCPWRQYDIEQAVNMLIALDKENWHLTRNGGATAEMGL